ncbi:MAG: hypothetical protein ACREL7_04975 [Longimicrobiales bacterium]
MSGFVDRDGNAWDIILGRGSWGTWVALFIPISHLAPVRQSVLDADAWNKANDELEGMTTPGLHDLFDRSTIKDE